MPCTRRLIRFLEQWRRRRRRQQPQQQVKCAARSAKQAETPVRGQVVTEADGRRARAKPTRYGPRRRARAPQQVLFIERCAGSEARPGGARFLFSLLRAARRRRLHASRYTRALVSSFSPTNRSRAEEVSRCRHAAPGTQELVSGSRAALCARGPRARPCHAVAAAAAEPPLQRGGSCDNRAAQGSAAGAPRGRTRPRPRCARAATRPRRGPAAPS